MLEVGSKIIEPYVIVKTFDHVVLQTKFFTKAMVGFPMPKIINLWNKILRTRKRIECPQAYPH